jgi:hypothetical protein
MPKKSQPNQIRTVLSIEPLLQFWREKVSPQCKNMAEMFVHFERMILKTPALQGDIRHLEDAALYEDILIPLMSVVFPSSTLATEIAGAFKPFSADAIFLTPPYRRYLLDSEGKIAGRLKGDGNDLERNKILRSYALILNRLYGIEQGFNTPIVRIVKDVNTDLERHFQLNPDFQFLQVGTVGNAPVLSESQRTQLLDRVADPEALVALLPPEKFVLRGFTVVRAVDVTESEITSELGRDLIDQESIFSTDGFKRLQRRLRSLFRMPELKAGMSGLRGEKVLIFNDGQTSDTNCLFTNSHHFKLAELKNSIWEQAAEEQKILTIPDLRQEPNPSALEKDLINHGVRSILVAPLHFGGDNIGSFWLKSVEKETFSAIDIERTKQLAPLFAMALKRGLEDMSKEVQAIINEKCTAVHPSVAWRFEKAAVDHMESVRLGMSSEMDSIVFKDVIPLFGQSDIRGSSDARVKSITADLTEQLTLAGHVMKTASAYRSWPLVDELHFQIQKRMVDLRNVLSADEESLTASFLRSEVETSFDELQQIHPKVNHAIETYRRMIDPDLGVVYRKRRAFEESVSLLNRHLSVYLDHRQNEAQRTFPHYFEKRQTDGLDYVIYLGASMHPEEKYSRFHLKNLTLWQLEVACGLAWQTHKVQSQLKVPLDTCHLILVNHSPLSIRFRYDEKRFDVDGAYDVRHEIIKSRLDKAMVRGGRERLTQPGKIAVVFSHPREGQYIQRYIEYLQDRQSLLPGVENIDLEDMPGVRGLKALRVDVNLKGDAALQAPSRKAG